MRIAIVGAGAIGGMIAALLARAGSEPLLIARGDTLARLKRHGIRFAEKDIAFDQPIRVTDDPAAFGPQDLVVLATKAHQIPGGLPAIQALSGPDTRLLTAINGVPWWFFQRWCPAQSVAFSDNAADVPGRILRSVDPEGHLAAALPAERIIGCAVYLAVSVAEPFTVESGGVRRLVCGRADGQEPDEELHAIARLFDAAALPMPLTTNIHTEIMNKLMGNIWANPLSVVTGGTMADLTGDAGTRAVGYAMMAEFEALCSAIGIDLPLTIDKRLEGAERLGGFRTSMLQDFDRGRMLELDAILGAAIEIAARTGTGVPTLETVHALTRARAVAAGCYPATAGI